MQLFSFCKWGQRGELTWMDMDPCCSWFGCRQVGLKGHTSAALLSQWPFPHSEQSSSEHLEEPETVLVAEKQHKHGWQPHCCDSNSKVSQVSRGQMVFSQTLPKKNIHLMLLLTWHHFYMPHLRLRLSKLNDRWSRFVFAPHHKEVNNQVLDNIAKSCADK